MKAAQIVAPRRVEIVDIPEPHLEDNITGMLKVKIERGCLCGSDSPWFAYDHRVSENSIPTRWTPKGEDAKNQSVYPLRPGLAIHECLGTVVESTSTRFQVGDLVMAMPEGQAGLCEYFCFPDKQAVGLPRQAVPLEQILMTQPLGTVVWACKKLGNLVDLDTAVVGSGPMGLLIAHMLSNLGARTVTVLDRYDYRLKVAHKMRATHTIHVDQQDPVSAVREITQGRMADVVFEVVGHQALDIAFCADILRAHGTLVGFGMPDQEFCADFPIWDFLSRNLTFIGSEGPDPVPNYSLARDMIVQGRIDVSPIITHVLPFDEIQRAYDLFVDRQDGAIKVVLDYETIGGR
jgi:threonine dehydrogenase-like Zn-dependent dehydrogenase